MKNFKKIYAIAFAAAAILVGVMFVINDIKGGMFEIFQYLFSEDLGVIGSIIFLLWFILDVAMVLVPVVYIFVVIYDKKEPFRAILGCGMAVLGKYLFVILIVPLLFYPLKNWVVDYIISAEVLVPLIALVVALALLSVAKKEKNAGTTLRTILTTVGAALVVFGLVYYFVIGDAATGWGKVGVFVSMAAYIGAAVYCFLPMTKEQKAE